MSIVFYQHIAYYSETIAEREAIAGFLNYNNTNMRSEINFIKLPLLTRIKVQNYPLFARDWEYNVKTGLNLFVGANGLGKTTVTNLIIQELRKVENELSLGLQKELTMQSVEGI